MGRSSSAALTLTLGILSAAADELRAASTASKEEDDKKSKYRKGWESANKDDGTKPPTRESLSLALPDLL